MIPKVNQLIEDFDRLGYVVEEELATVLLLTLDLNKPILLEGPPGVGKTEAAHIYLLPEGPPAVWVCSGLT